MRDQHAYDAQGIDRRSLLKAGMAAAAATVATAGGGGD